MKKLECDWCLDEDNEFVWIAEVENEYIQQPHGYGQCVDFTGKDAKQVISKLSGLTGQEFTDKVREIFNESV